jgi:hypothetical protein
MAKLRLPESGKARTTVESALNKILDAFATGEIVPAIARCILQRDAVPLDGWSFRNKLMAFIAGTTDARTIKAWSKVGRKLKKGVRAFYVWEPIKRYGENENTGEKYSYLVGFRVSPRFRVEDTEGEPLPKNEAENVEPPALYEAAEKLGIPVEYQAVHTVDIPAWGWYSPTEKRMCLYTDDPRVFYHELAHAAHDKVLKRRKKKLEGKQDAKQEAVAELTAAALAEVYGSKTTMGNSYEYITKYASEMNVDAWELSMSVISDVEACIREIIPRDQ